MNEREEKSLPRTCSVSGVRPGFLLFWHGIGRFNVVFFAVWGSLVGVGVHGGVDCRWVWELTAELGIWELKEWRTNRG